MSFAISRWGKQQPRLRGMRRAVLLELCDRANEEGVCFPSEVRLAEDCGCCVRTVRNAIAYLLKRRLISRVTDLAERAAALAQTGARWISKQANVYRILCRAEDVAARALLEAQLELDLKVAEPVPEPAAEHRQNLPPLEAECASEPGQNLPVDEAKFASESITEPTKESEKEPSPLSESEESETRARAHSLTEVPCGPPPAFHRFNEFWAAYPFQTNHGPAERVYRQVIEAGIATHEGIMAGLRRWIAHPDRPKEPRWWLTDRNWLDAPAINPAAACGKVVTDPLEIAHTVWAEMAAEDARRAAWREAA